MTQHRRTGATSALAAAAVLLLAACSADPPTDDTAAAVTHGSPTSAPTSPPAAADEPSGSPGSDRGSDGTTHQDPDYTVLDASASDDGLPLAPGRYAIRAMGGHEGQPWAVLDVGGGFGAAGAKLEMNDGIASWMYSFILGRAHAPDHRDHGVGYWTVSRVDKDPCDATAGTIDPGESVDGLVRALAEQRLTTTTEPTRATLDGYRGVYLELAVPADIDFSGCLGGAFNVWRSEPDGARYMQAPGQIDRLWILDLNGRRVVLQATAVPGVPAEKVEELVTMVESVAFVQPDWR